MRNIYATKVLRCSTHFVKRFISMRKFWHKVAFTIIITIIFLHMLLPLNRPVFFLKYTEIGRTHNVNKYVHKYPGTYRNLKSQYKIVLWTTWFKHELWWNELGESVFTGYRFSNCVLTYNKSDVYTADALLFHTQDLYDFYWFVKRPTGSYYNPLPNYRTKEQVWVLINQEPPVNIVMDYTRFNGVFNWTGTYRQASEIHMPYGRVVKRTRTNKDDTVRENVKRTGVVWIAGNCFDHARRQLLIQELQKYIRIDKFGFCGKEHISNEALDKSRYKFYLSFENSVCEEYITEKFFARLKKGMLPVVYGGADYKKLAPPHSYIDIRDFNSAKEVADYLNYLERNDTAYKEYFEWTKDYKLLFISHWCSMCEALNSQRPHQVYADLEGWFGNDICQPLSFAQRVAQSLDGFASYIGLI